MLKILGDFHDNDELAAKGKISFEENQKFFEHARLHGIDDSVYPFAVGGSDASAIFGVNPWTSPRQLILSKVYPEKYDSPITPARRHILNLGHHFEDGIAHMCAELLQEQLGKPVTLIPSTLQYLDTDYPHCIADVDYLAMIGDELNLIEVKSSRPFSEATSLYSMGGIPIYYQYQVQYYMEVLKKLDIKGGYLFAGWGFNPEEDFAMIHFDRDEELGRKILQGCEATVQMAAKGYYPNNNSVMSPDVMKQSNAVLYGTIDPSKPAKELTGDENAVLLEKLSAINAELKEGRSTLRKIRNERVSSKEENDIKSRQDALETEKEKIIQQLMEETKDCDGAFMKTDIADYVMDVSRDFGVDKSVKDYLKEKHPEVYEEISRISPKLSVNVKRRAKQ